MAEEKKPAKTKNFFKALDNLIKSLFGEKTNVVKQQVETQITMPNDEGFLDEVNKLSDKIIKGIEGQPGFAFEKDEKHHMYKIKGNGKPVGGAITTKENIDKNELGGVSVAPGDEFISKKGVEKKVTDSVSNLKELFKKNMDGVVTKIESGSSKLPDGVYVVKKERALTTTAVALLLGLTIGLAGKGTIKNKDAQISIDNGVGIEDKVFGEPYGPEVPADYVLPGEEQNANDKSGAEKNQDVKENESTPEATPEQIEEQNNKKLADINEGLALDLDGKINSIKDSADYIKNTKIEFYNEQVNLGKMSAKTAYGQKENVTDDEWTNTLAIKRDYDNRLSIILATSESEIEKNKALMDLYEDVCNTTQELNNESLEIIEKLKQAIEEHNKKKPTDEHQYQLEGLEEEGKKVNGEVTADKQTLDVIGDIQENTENATTATEVVEGYKQAIEDNAHLELDVDGGLTAEPGT